MTNSIALAGLSVFAANAAREFDTIQKFVDSPYFKEMARMHATAKELGEYLAPIYKSSFNTEVFKIISEMDTVQYKFPSMRSFDVPFRFDPPAPADINITVNIIITNGENDE